MSSHYRVVICGQSVFLMAIEAGLAESVTVEVIRLDTHTPNLPRLIVSHQDNSHS